MLMNRKESWQAKCSQGTYLPQLCRLLCDHVEQWHRLCPESSRSALVVLGGTSLGRQRAGHILPEAVPPACAAELGVWAVPAAADGMDTAGTVDADPAAESGAAAQTAAAGGLGA